MEQTNGNGKAVASLVLGIISIVCVTGFFYTSLIGVVTGILAIVFGNKARREAKSGIATAGFVCGIGGLSMCALLFVSCSCYMIYVNRGISYYYW